MAKTVTAQSVSKPTNIKLEVKAGVITGATADVEINYGTFGRSETVNLWATLSKEQQQALQDIYNAFVVSTESATVL